MQDELTIRPTSPATAEAQALIAELDAYQSALYPAKSNHLDSCETLQQDHVHFLGAFKQKNFEREQLVATGAIKIFDEYAEIKRLYVLSIYRGQGIARRLVSALEDCAQNNGVQCTRLETGIHQAEAIKLYKTLGYRRISPFGTYANDPLSVFMGKKLTNR